MGDVRDEINSIIDDLKQVRDELKVQLHLAKEDIKDEWESAEEKLQHLETKGRELGHATRDAAEDVGVAAKLLAEEVQKGFDHIRKQFK